MTEYPALQLLIDGESFDGTNREIIDVIDPATGEVIAQLPSATNSDLAKALEATKEAFDFGVPKVQMNVKRSYEKEPN